MMCPSSDTSDGILLDKSQKLAVNERKDDSL